MTLALLCGAGVGLGVVLIWRALYPPRPALAALLTPPAAREPSIPQVPDRHGGWAASVGRRLAEVLPVSPRVRRDLAVCGRSPELHTAEKAALALFGFALAPVTAAAMTLGGVSVPIAVPVWASAVLAVGGYFTPDAGIRGEAASRRRDMRFALGAFLDLVVVSLAGGAGVDGALEDAAQTGDGWAFGHIRQALVVAKAKRTTPWAELARLGEEIGVAELGELAASVSLAGTEGARIRASLAAKAQSLRSHLSADAEADAQATTERMSLPAVLLFAGFLLFIAYPAMDRVLSL